VPLPITVTRKPASGRDQPVFELSARPGLLSALQVQQCEHPFINTSHITQVHISTDEDSVPYRVQCFGWVCLFGINLQFGSCARAELRHPDAFRTQHSKNQ